MDCNRQLLLKLHRNLILDLRVDDVIDKLLSTKALSIDDYDLIKQEKNDKERTRKLIDLISKGDNAVYDKFVHSLKEYHRWIWEKLQLDGSSISAEMLIENVEDTLSRGEVPKLPIHYVSRLGLEERLVVHLQDLKRHGMLLVHGMPGSGKSSLIAGTLRKNHKLIVDTFKGKVFWINVGDCRTTEQIVQLQTRMIRRLTPDEIALNNSTSILSFGSMSGSFYEPDWEDYRDRLKKSFEEIGYREALLVIDDLKDKKVIEAFDIGCKILITSQDSKLVEGETNILDVPASLGETESLKLISISVDQPVHKLPPYAKTMHSICKGSPLLMSMVAGMLAENKESLKHDKKRWSQLVKQLKNKSSFLDRFNYGVSASDPFLAVEVCINSLKDEEFIKKYKSLAVLPENIKISTQALSTIFGMTTPEVEKLMKLFKTKSLIIEHYSIDRKMYLYEVHDLIHSYLIHIHKEEDKKRLHVNLLNRYMEKNSDLTDLPDDGYIAYHIGYHIYHTGDVDNKWSLFHSLYTSLEFIGNKIRLTGPSSMIDDLQYFYEIRNNHEHNEIFIDSLRKFISNHGPDLHRYPNTDILQSIFQHEHEGPLYEEALNVAKRNENKDHLYLQFQYDQSEEINYSTIHIDEKLNVVRFWLHYVFVGNESGTISLWNINAYQKLSSYVGHKATVKFISVNNITPFKMASTCAGGILKVWNISNLNNHTNDDLSDSDGEDSFKSDYSINESVLTISHASGKLCDVTWGHLSDMLLTHTNPGSMLLLYNAKGAVLKCINVGEDNEISCSILSADDSLAIVGFNSKSKKQHGVWMYSTKSYDRLITFTEFDEIKMLSLIPNKSKSLLVLTKTYFQVHSWNQEMISNSNQAIRNITHLKVQNKEISYQNDYVFQTAVIGRDSYIFISTTDCHIVVYDLSKNLPMGLLNNHRGTVMTMDVMEYNDDPSLPCSHILITASNADELLKLWCVDASQFSSHIIRKPIFDCVFNPKSQEPSPRVNHSRDKSDPSVLRRAETIASPENAQKFYLRKTLSLDKKHLKLINLKCVTHESVNTPLIAVADNSNCVQVIKGKNLIGKTSKAASTINCIALSPCGDFLSYGMENGDVVLYSLKTMSGNIVMQIREHVSYIEFLDSSVLVAGGSDNCLMMYEISSYPASSSAKMIINSRYDLGSQELLDSIAGKRKTPESNGNNNGSPVSDSSSSSIGDVSVNNHKRVHRDSSGLCRYSPILKCFLLRQQLISISRDGTVKLWNFEPTLVAVLVGKQNDMFVSCACLRSSYLVLCNRNSSYSGCNGDFQVYQLTNSNPDKLIQAKHVTQYPVSEKITCCNISYDGKILAMGCASGNIVLWHIKDKMLISLIKFHKIAVQSLEFSPTPIDCQENSAPLVLISLAGQVAWWNVSMIIKKKKEFLRRHEKGNLMSPLAALSLTDIHGTTEESCIFRFPTNTSWEKLWRGKKCKNKFNKKELLSCVKLRGERALKIKMDASFSSFITVDQGGILYIMNILQNNQAEYEATTPNSE